MEMTATNLSRRKTHPILLVRSSEAVPQWVSSLESHKLAVGESNFTCCERNHEGVFEKCDREVAKDVLDRLISKKTEYLFGLGHAVSARLTCSQRPWFLRGLLDDSSDMYTTENVKDFRTSLDWSTTLDETWFDRGGISILFYAVVSKDVRIVKTLLKGLNEVTSEKEKTRRLISAVPENGFVQAGITGKMNALSVQLLKLLKCFLIKDSTRCLQIVREIILFFLRVSAIVLAM
jgi:hypothetical protein